MSYPGDNDIVYAVEAVEGGVRGILVCAYGVYADPPMTTLMMAANEAAETAVN